MRLRNGPSMSGTDEPIPKRLSAMVRWAIKNHPWAFFLICLERLADRDFKVAAVFGSIFVADLFVASRWDEIDGFVKRRKSMLLYLALGGAGLLLVGIAIGGLWNVRLSTGTSLEAIAYTGRITWNFDQIIRGQANFLNLGRLNDGEIRVVGFGVHGKNTSKDPITEFRGYVRSDLTNAQLPIFVMAEVPAAAGRPLNPFDPSAIPTRFEETYGIPGMADFDIVSFENAVIQTGIDGMPVSQFLRDFGSCTLVLEYDGIKVEQKFTSEMIKNAIDTFEASLNPRRITTIPRVTRRPNATTPIQSVLPFPLPPTATPPDVTGSTPMAPK
jgi:hypothetical protein